MDVKYWLEEEPKDVTNFQFLMNHVINDNHHNDEDLVLHEYTQEPELVIGSVGSVLQVLQK